jgi:hypothetical protein
MSKTCFKLASPIKSTFCLKIRQKDQKVIVVHFVKGRTSIQATSRSLVGCQIMTVDDERYGVTALLKFDDSMSDYEEIKYSIVDFDETAEVKEPEDTLDYLSIPTQETIMASEDLKRSYATAASINTVSGQTKYNYSNRQLSQLKALAVSNSELIEHINVSQRVLQQQYVAVRETLVKTTSVTVLPDAIELVIKGIINGEIKIDLKQVQSMAHLRTVAAIIQDMHRFTSLNEVELDSLVLVLGVNCAVHGANLQRCPGFTMGQLVYRSSIIRMVFIQRSVAPIFFFRPISNVIGQIIEETKLKTHLFDLARTINKDLTESSYKYTWFCGDSVDGADRDFMTRLKTAATSSRKRIRRPRS